MHVRLITAALVVAASALPTSAADKTLTEQEAKHGWLLLFDGKTTAGWMTTKSQPLPERHVQNGSLNPHPCDYMLVHEREWGNYVLSLEFKISPKCNSGIFIRTSPLTPRPGKDIGFNGIEIAIDDTQAAGFHDTGAIYDLVKPAQNAMKPAGEWNRIVITSNNNLIAVELNGKAVTRMGLDQWPAPNKRPDGSQHKFDVAYRDHPRKGYIGFQDHGADCWYRNIKLKPLAEAVPASAANSLWDLESLRKTPKITWEDTSGPLRKLYYESEPRDGRPTRVFAYCAFPETQQGKAPGVVLIHGGGGTAFPEWATLWAKRGYVAIAMDLAGKGADRKPLSDGGPDQTDTFKLPKSETPLKDVWSYHSVAAAIRGASVLASLPDVDADRLAVTGISWGGYLTCIVAGLDDRFKAAVPVYGCGFLPENSAWLAQFAAMEPDWKQTWIRDFDPSQHVGKARMPVLFVNGTNDFAYPLDSYQKTYRLVKDRALCVTVNMPHGHPQGWAPKEIGLFIDQHLRRGTPLPTIGREVKLSDDKKAATVAFKNAQSSRAQLHWTTDTDIWQKRQWQNREARISDSEIAVEFPAERPITAFVTLTDKRGATVITEHFVVP